MKTAEPNAILKHVPCPSPECSSSDGYSVDPDTGWGKCFVCGVRVPPGEEIKMTVIKKSKNRPVTPIPETGFGCPEDRGIKNETCEKYKIWTDKDGKTYFPCFENGVHIGNKVRYDGKKIYVEGRVDGDLFGSQLFPPGGAKAITVVTGEYDAPSAFELMGSKYPVVSVFNGDDAASSDCKRNFEYLDAFDEIVLAFDSDESGQKAAKKVASLGFAPGKVRMVRLQEHRNAKGKTDANEYLKARDHGKFTKEWWQGPIYMPDGLKIGTELWDTIINRPNHFTIQTPFHGLNKMTYGIRLSEMLVLTADPKIGKTTFMKELEYSILMNPEVKEKGYGVGFIHLEEPNYDTALGLMSVHHSKPYHLPDTERTVIELRKAYNDVINSERVVIWDHFGSNRVEAVLDKIRHMVALGCKYIVLDHLSIVVSDQSGDERKQLDEIATKLKTLCMEQNIALICVIHQNRAGQIRGTAGVEQLANIVVKLSRDKLDPDPWRRHVTKVVVEHNRFCGRTGPACYLWYNEMTGRMMELNEEEVAKYEAGGGLREDEYPW